MSMLTDAQVERYSRQILVPGIGGRGQERLLASTVAVIDPHARLALCVDYLTAAGIGRVPVYGAAAPFGDATTGECRIQSEPSTSAAGRIVAAEVVIDTRSVRQAAELLDACRRGARAFVWAAAVGSCALVARIPTGAPLCGMCLRHAAEPLAEPIPGDLDAIDWSPFATAWAAAVAATAAIKSILAIGAASPVMTRYDAAAGELESIALHSDPRCTACGESASA